MSPTPSFGRLDVEPDAEKPSSSTLFRIAYLADFSGRGARGERGDADEVAARKPVVVHRDDLDEVMAGFEAAAPLPVLGGKKPKSQEVPFAALDELSPDALWDKVDPLLRKLADETKRTAQMNAFLHAPAFQSVESAWRGVDWLLRRVAKDEKVEVVLVDLAFDEFVADLDATEDLAETGLHRLLTKYAEGRNPKPFAAVFLDGRFEPSAAHAQVLGRAAKIAAAARAPLFAGIDSRVLDEKFKFAEEDSEAWDALRESREAAWLVLGASQFLLRQPYGAKNLRIERFDYEEMSDPPKREEYLWGSPGLACVALAAAAFMDKGWAMKPGAVLSLPKMPMHLFVEDGESVAALTDMATIDKKVMQKLRARGFTTFLPVKGRDEIQAVVFQSLACGPLAGRWMPGAGAAKAEKAGKAAFSSSVQMGVGAPPAKEDVEEESAEAPAEEEAAAAEAAPAADEPEASEEAPAEETSDESPAEEAPAAEETPSDASGDDVDLDALLKSLDAPAEEAAEPAGEGKQEEEEVDLDALLKSLEEPSS
jgi:type VI secretion system protein ImpC